MARHPSRLSPALPAPSSSADDRFTAAAARYRCALAGAVLDASRELAGAAGKPPSPRLLVNFLRGNQPPRAGLPPPSQLFGLLAPCTAAALHELVSNLHGEGLLPAGIDPGAFDAATLSRLFPAHPRLGAHPELEEKLRLLRQELALGEGRAAFSIFPNAALAAIAAARPQSMAELSEMPGLATARLKKYGARILAVCRRGAATGRRRAPRG